MVGRHANSGEPSPHARFRAGRPFAKVAETRESERTAGMTPAPCVSQPGAPEDRAEGLLVPFLKFQNLIFPGYQGAAILDDEFRQRAAKFHLYGMYFRI